MTDKLVSWSEAAHHAEEVHRRLEQKQEQALQAEADYWRKFLNEDRIEELEAEIAQLRTLLHAVAVQVVSAQMRIDCQSTLSPKRSTYYAQLQAAVELLEAAGACEFETGELDV